MPGVFNSVYRNVKGHALRIEVGVAPGVPPDLFEAEAGGEFVGPTAYEDFFRREHGAIKLKDLGEAKQKSEVEHLRERIKVLTADNDDLRAQIRELKREAAAAKPKQAEEQAAPIDPPVVGAVIGASAPEKSPKKGK